ncbi:conserved hypothetical protein [Ricinus communis]|uniref:Uncharacterized protein n=1 Tax=Ricinus communis TaxID=3988 RepID=B9SA79_RICCO|nr:conserved hypothetical protein [Ricinus communis]
MRKECNWKSWPTLCHRKSSSGLGFKDLQSSNLAPSAKEKGIILLRHNVVFGQAKTFSSNR